jgi:hypothetical protein
VSTVKENSSRSRVIVESGPVTDRMNLRSIPIGSISLLATVSGIEEQEVFGETIRNILKVIDWEGHSRQPKGLAETAGDRVLPKGVS